MEGTSRVSVYTAPFTAGTVHVESVLLLRVSFSAHYGPSLRDDPKRTVTVSPNSRRWWRPESSERGADVAGCVGTIRDPTVHSKQTVHRQDHKGTKVHRESRQ